MIREVEPDGMEKQTQAIGVFDSGVGGLTAVKELLKLVPQEDILYFGDTARVPYGSHSPETIIRFAKQDLSFLLSRDVKAVLIACGTVSSTAIGELRKLTSKPIVGVIDAAAERAVRQSRNGRILALATQATIRSHAYRDAILSLEPSARVEERACPLFVPLIENGYADRSNPVTQLVVRDYLAPYREFGADTVILGCTHYPLIQDAIRDVLPGAELVEAGKEAAKELARLLKEGGLLVDRESSGERRYVVSEKTDSFQDICTLFLGERMDGVVEVVHLDE